MVLFSPVNSEQVLDFGNGWKKIIVQVGRKSLRKQLISIVSPSGQRFTSTSQLARHIQDTKIFDEINPEVVNFDSTCSKSAGSSFSAITKQLIQFVRTKGMYKPRAFNLI